MQTEEELVIAPDNWFEYEPGEVDDSQIKEYDITASPEK